jgi:hypothetical protein
MMVMVMTKCVIDMHTVQIYSYLDCSALTDISGFEHPFQQAHSPTLYGWFQSAIGNLST